MRVLVCVKRVPAPGAKINITEDGQSVDATNLGHTMSPHEECALELAVQLVEAHGGESHVLTLGVSEADEQCRWAASIGINKATLVDVGTQGWDPQRTATALTDSIRSIGRGRLPTPAAALPATPMCHRATTCFVPEHNAAGAITATNW